MSSDHPRTPDGRYMVVSGRLWWWSPGNGFEHPQSIFPENDQALNAFDGFGRDRCVRRHVDAEMLDDFIHFP